MKKLIIGLFIGLMLGMSTNAFAAIGDKVQAVFAEFNYVVNGQSTTLDSPVLVYEGVSYVRTTDISNMLGYDVTYKKDSRTIAFNNPDVIATPAPMSMLSVTDATYTPTPDPNATPSPTPDPNATPSPSPTPDPNATPEPIATPVPSSEPTATPVATATPTPAPTAVPVDVPGGGDRTAYCRTIPPDTVAYIIAGCQ
jgi:hypothetical protein